MPYTAASLVKDLEAHIKDLPLNEKLKILNDIENGLLKYSSAYDRFNDERIEKDAKISEIEQQKQREESVIYQNYERLIGSLNSEDDDYATKLNRYTTEWENRKKLVDDKFKPKLEKLNTAGKEPKIDKFLTSTPPQIISVIETLPEIADYEANENDLPAEEFVQNRIAFLRKIASGLRTERFDLEIKTNTAETNKKAEDKAKTDQATLEAAKAKAAQQAYVVPLPPNKPVPISGKVDKATLLGQTIPEIATNSAEITKTKGLLRFKKQMEDEATGENRKRYGNYAIRGLGIGAAIGLALMILILIANPAIVATAAAAVGFVSAMIGVSIAGAVIGAGAGYGMAHRQNHAGENTLKKALLEKSTGFDYDRMRHEQQAYHNSRLPGNLQDTGKSPTTTAIEPGHFQNLVSEGKKIETDLGVPARK